MKIKVYINKEQYFKIKENRGIYVYGHTSEPKYDRSKFMEVWVKAKKVSNAPNHPYEDVVRVDIKEKQHFNMGAM